MREQLRIERDREIEMVINRLEEESVQQLKETEAQVTKETMDAEWR